MVDSTIAEGIAVKQPGQLTLPIVRELVSRILVVDEFRIEEAVLLLLEIEKTVVEGAGAAALAALLAEPERFVGRRVGLILSGGNIDLLPLSSVIQRGLVRSGRLVRLRVEVRDAPGSLAEVASAIGEAGGNIIETHHKRAFTNLPLQSAEVEFVVQARGAEHLREILEGLAAGGYRAEAVGIEPADRPRPTGRRSATARARCRPGPDRRSPSTHPGPAAGSGSSCRPPSGVRTPRRYRRPRSRCA